LFEITPVALEYVYRVPAQRFPLASFASTAIAVVAPAPTVDANTEAVKVDGAAA